MAGVGDAHGKLLLFGEHAAVYGHVAVGMSLPERTTVRLEGAATDVWNMDGIPPADRAVVTELLARLERGVEGSIFRRARSVRIESSIPRGLGFGSSAALCVAAARAFLLTLYDDPGVVDTDSVWSIAHDAERLFHGNPSGVDTGISLIGGTCIIKPKSRGLPEYMVMPRRGVPLVVGAVGRDEKCAALIAGLGERMKAGDGVARASISELGELSRCAARLFQTGGENMARYAGALADAAMGTLRALGLSTPDLEAVLEAARRAGALGGKLSGAGGGGAFYAVAPDEEAAALIARSVLQECASRGIPLLSGPRVVVA